MKIKAKLKSISQYGTFFKDKSVVLPISVGQLYHEEGKFSATLETIQQRFVKCDIVIADTLQRYNFSNESPEVKLIEKTRQLGTDWLERNQVYLDNFLLPYKIIRWEECILWSGFKQCLEIVKNFYQTNRTYQLAIQQDINAFAKRKRYSHTDNIEEFTAKCLAYLFEETAVMLSYFVDHEYHYIIYPTAIPQSVAQIRDAFVFPKHPNLLQNLEIHFKKINRSIKHEAF